MKWKSFLWSFLFRPLEKLVTQVIKEKENRQDHSKDWSFSVAIDKVNGILYYFYGAGSPHDYLKLYSTLCTV